MKSAPKAKKKTFTIGLDLGGTKLAGALLDSSGQAIDFIKVPVDMKREGSPKKTQRRVIETMADIVLDFKHRYPKETAQAVFKGVGLASAGPLNAEEGKLINPANYPGWKTVFIRDLTQNEIVNRGFKTQVFFQHDASAAALAEGWAGGAQGLSSYAVVTVGTGIGTGVIFRGHPCQSFGMGSEYGHSIVDIQKLQQYPERVRDCTVEGIASGTGLLQRAQALGFRGDSVEQLVSEADKKYLGLYDDMAFALACLCHNLSIGYNLEKIFLSGGLIKIKRLFFPQMKAHYRKFVRQINPAFECPIEIAQTKNHAGVIGAGYLPYLK
jgi:glucokinase